MPYRMVSQNLSHDTVTACEQLLALAKSGQAIGMGVVVLMKRHRYLIDASGEVVRDPTFARGALCALDDCLRHQMPHHQAFNEPPPR